ncbi:MAG: PUA domain-containing protein, partial [Candidatus Thermoplasmatota archaeon]|nr:PUA domain-containing protein [Candidatus Thermoplasmatota archaeon]
GGHLLPAGITGVDGSFPPGSVVEIVQAGQPVGKAVSTFSAKELEVAKGHRSAKVRELLGREGSCNVTRKNEVLLQGNGSTRKPEDPG